MTIEERQKQINNLIMTMAHDNPNIKPSQVSRAKSLYLTDTRSLEDIEKELSQYSQEINQAVADKAYVEQTQAVIDNAFAQKQAEYSDTIIQSGPMQDIESSEPLTPIEPTPRVEQPQDVTSELDEMFEPTTSNEDSFEKGESIGEKSDNKVLVKTSVSTQKAGFSTLSSLVTLASLLSIMGIVISALIIYTR